MIHNNYHNVKRNCLTLKMQAENMMINNIWMIFVLILMRTKNKSIFSGIKMVKVVNNRMQNQLN